MFIIIIAFIKIILKHEKFYFKYKMGMGIGENPKINLIFLINN